MAEPYLVAVSPHNYNSTTVGLAATLQVSAAIPNFLITEYFVNFEARGAGGGASRRCSRSRTATSPCRRRRASASSCTRTCWPATPTASTPRAPCPTPGDEGP